MYSIVISNYQTKETYQLCEYDFKFDALVEMEDYLFGYLLEKQGVSPLIFYQTVDIPKIPKNKFFIVKSNDILHKFTVNYKKENKGMLYNSFEINKIFDILLIKNLKEVEPLVYNQYEEYTCFQAYDHVMNELLSKVSIKNEYSVIEVNKNV